MVQISVTVAVVSLCFNVLLWLRPFGCPACDDCPHSTRIVKAPPLSCPSTMADGESSQRCPSPPECPPCGGSPAAGEPAADPASPDTSNNNGDAGSVNPHPGVQQRALVGLDGVHTNGEIGWTLGLERKATRTDNTIYDPKQDPSDVHKPGDYSHGFVPKGKGWKVRVAKDRWVTMDDVCFAYDVWFEENQIFQYASWMGVFIQQDPMDAFAIQDMLWRVQPDLIIEVGTNTGGGAIFYATIMKAYNPQGKIVTLDVKEVSNWHQRGKDRCKGCVLATQHQWWNDGMITFMKARVTEASTRQQLDAFVAKAKTVLVIEDASHRYPDTLDNMKAIYQYVTVGSYLLVQDTKMDRFVHGLGKKYGRYKFGPMRSVDEFMQQHGDQFVVDRSFEYFLYSQHHRGYLRRVK